MIVTHDFSFFLVKMLTDANYEDLETKGYTVIPDVLTSQECEETIGQYKDWLSQFQDGDWPYSANSLINRYNVGNMHPTWLVRLKSKKVFAQIWKTEKLLTSVDAIAIGRPPEKGDEDFHRPGDHWLHLDQSSLREGLHAYQGGVYLENAEEDDWTLVVMEGSHLLCQDFFDKNQRASQRSAINEYYSLLDKEVKEFEQKGCKLKRVAVPKGGMVLWDSRLVHANANPIKGRNNPGRWRFCVFVSMTPAIWASREDMGKKKETYNSVAMTTHWSSQCVRFSKTYMPSYAKSDVSYPNEIPAVARSHEAKKLAGVLQYNFGDGKPNGDDYFPYWKNGYTPKIHEKSSTIKTGMILCVVAGVALAISIAVVRLTK